ncbi:hypothetical protein [Caulobacter sp. Root655]|uniref:hypothetical protein n=1 Tax=Caulobacter sp. Root655 TaxID=1736578 RepID=UPI0012E38672|nr:hypothetical protein [Caulobacter sp. Root655]
MAKCIASSEAFAMHTTSHNFLKDYGLMLSVMSGPEKSVFDQACREYQYSLEAIIRGNYRHAFSSLRLSLELFIASVYFSAHLMKLKLWSAGTDDLHWATITDNDKGVFSHAFLGAFNAELGTYRTQYAKLASSVYRECSEYVHGNPITHEDSALNIEFDFDKTIAFHERADTVRLCIIFVFSVRYLSELDGIRLNIIEPVVMDALGTIAEVQGIFGATGK